MWVLLGPGDSALVPSPSYPIHLAGPGFAGAKVITVPMLDPGATTNDPAMTSSRVSSRRGRAPR